MRLSSCAAFAGALLSPLVDAKLVFGQQYCVTSYGPTSARFVPTFFVRTQKTFTFTATSTSTPTQTITPTSTITATASVTTTTTAVQRTNTATSTTSSTDVVTATSTTTSTATDTATVTTTVSGTVTASTSAGFTPFASLPAVVANGGANMKRDVDDPVTEAVEPRSDVLTREARIDSCQPPPGHGPGRPFYPQSVTCLVFTERIVVSKVVKPATTTKMVTAKSSASVTTTSTTTLVSTFVPANITVTTTSTALTTSTTTAVVTASTTTTTTSTSTSVLPVATSYPQCGADNKVSKVGGRNLYYNVPNGGTAYIGAGVISDDACCQLCANTDFCVGFSNHPFECYIFTTPGTCDGSKAGWRSIPQGSQLTVQGNGNCGQAAYSNTF